MKTVASCFVILCFLFWPQNGWARFIQLKAEPHVRIEAKLGIGKLQGSCRIENLGDETAYRVVPVIQFGEKRWQGEARNLVPRSNTTWEVEIVFESTPFSPAEVVGQSDLHGEYPLFVTSRYEDKNGKQFSASLAQKILVEPIQFSAPPIDVLFRCNGDGHKFLCNLTLRNVANLDRKLRVALFTTEELQSDVEQLSVELNGNQVKNYPMELTNIHGLPDSSYSVFAVVQWSEENANRVAIASSSAQIYDSHGGWGYLLLGGLFFIGQSMLLYFTIARSLAISRPPGHTDSARLLT